LFKKLFLSLRPKDKSQQGYKPKDLYPKIPRTPWDFFVLWHKITKYFCFYEKVCTFAELKFMNFGKEEETVAFD
jgi:hypothetical protein